ncbi:hypothetical protein [Novosphingobium sp.]|jgi:hypothetical protein|uniref:hypothetical protein n=1 Tax=Novosphingobium sp. TaxID=1874826 RepID=UPI002FE2E4DA
MSQRLGDKIALITGATSGIGLASATVFAAEGAAPDAKETVTGADGTVTMLVRNQGLNVIHAVYDGPSDNPARYRNVEHTATLSFTPEHKPELQPRGTSTNRLKSSTRQTVSGARQIRRCSALRSSPCAAPLRG